MPLLKNGCLIDDAWVVVGDDEDIPAAGGAIVSLEVWQADRERLIGRNAPLGVALKNDQPVSALAEDLSQFALVSLAFPAYTDGRAYSQARRLRDRYGFAGEVRATGQVLRDQYPLMLRCGFDAFEVADGINLEKWQASVTAMHDVYQPAADGAQAIWAKRHAAA